MKIKIKESQIPTLLSEARMDGFRLDNLRTMSFSDKVAYCKKMLGAPIGNGSSRIVFQLDDYSCLKLAKNGKGVKQNEEEMRIGNSDYISIVPKILNGSDEENYQWVISEYVLPANEEDFEEVYKIEFLTIKEFVNALVAANSRSSRVEQDWGNKTTMRLYDEYDTNEDVVNLFNDISELYYGYDHGVGDLLRIQNWGMVNREYGPEMVILDTGLSQEIYNNYYSRGGRKY